jgi:hypothetical protein
VRGQLPIVIAATIVSAIILSSIYFITTMNIRSSIISVPYSILYWLKIDNELDTLAYIALREGSEAADQVFVKIYNATASNAQSLQDLENAVITATIEANKTMNNVVKSIIGNWTRLKEREGFTIRIEELSSTYYVGFGKGYSNVYFKFTIISPSGEYRVFSKNYTVFYGLRLRSTNINTLNTILSLLRQFGIEILPDVNLTVVFDATAYLDFNGLKHYYILDRRSAEIIGKNVFWFIQLIFGVSNIHYTPVGMYYYGKGHTRIAYYIDVSTYIIAALMVIYSGNIVGVTSYINVDGFIARSAISIS